MNVAYEIGKSNLQAAAERAAADRDRLRASERAQAKRMLVALALLMVAIAVVAYRDRQFLFESEPVQVQTIAEPAANPSEPVVSPAEDTANRASSTAIQTSPTTEEKTPTAPFTTTPIQAQRRKPVLAADQHASAATKASAAAGNSAKTGTPAAAVTAQAAQRARIANVTVQGPETTLYPRLDQRTKVEGSVELQALVGTDGSIQELHVVRGPAVLGSAAREAVLQWKFKPFIQNGVAVETYARVTVNFTIRVVDGSPKTVAAVEPEHVIILADNYQR